MGHTAKDCLERPRSKGAKWTGKSIAADDKIEDISLVGYESKRDRWNGYDAAEYARVMERYEQLEAARREAKKKEQVERAYAGGGGGDGANGRSASPEGGAAAAAAAADGKAPAAGGGDDEDLDDIKINESEAAEFAETKKRVRTAGGGSTGSVRNLRIREDTAKYLYNLDLNSAHYDPKSRSMREDPQPEKPLSEKLYAGDNFVRKSGEYEAWQALTLHSLQAYDKGSNVHMQALPSQAELLYKQFQDRKAALEAGSKQDILAKYAAEAPAAPDDVKQLAASERYVEYDRLGRVVKGVEVKAKSRYEEDVYVNNHTSVWGSWWKDGAWGYACCHGTVKNSYCLGKAGHAAAGAAAAQMAANIEHKAAEAAAKEAAAGAADADKPPSSLLSGVNPLSNVWGTDVDPNLKLDDAKLKAAIKAAEAAEREAAAADGGGADVGDDRKRKYNSLNGESAVGVTPEEMEAWRLKRSRGDDPMAAMMAKQKAAAAANGGDGGDAGNGGYDFV